MNNSEREGEGRIYRISEILPGVIAKIVDKCYSNIAIEMHLNIFEISRQG